MTIHELDVVALTVPLPDAEMFDGSDGLHPGDQGTVVGVWRDNAAYIVEFFRGGETAAIEDVTADQMRIVHHHRPLPAHSTIKA